MSTIQRTYAMIKPDAIKAGNMGNIISLIEKSGFTIVHAMLFKFTDKSAGQFYHEHDGKPFYKGLVEFMISGKVLGMVLEKENAINDLRALMGSTKPEEAADDTIRKLFGSTVPANAIHGSDSLSSAKREITYIFGEFASIPSSEKSLAKEY